MPFKKKGHLRDVEAPSGRVRRRGRPTLFTPALGSLICERLASGDSLVSIVGLQGVPTYQTVMNWLKRHPGFELDYRAARLDQADVLAEEIVAIADSAMDAPNIAAVKVIKLQIDARKWVAARLKPKVYGFH